MKYRKLPHGNEHFSILGLGMGSIHEGSEEEIEKTVKMAIENGINFFDMVASECKPYACYAKAFKNIRDKVYLQMHFGAVFDTGKYGWTRDLNTIKHTFESQLKLYETDYADMGYIHCIDEMSDYNDVISSGLWDYMKHLKSAGVIRHLGFSSHSPSMARRLLETGLMDMFMFSINPAYDFSFESGEACYSEERASLFRDCEKDGIGISVMKAFGGGQLLNPKTSPFKRELTRYQCIQYALDRPGVLTCLPGIRNRKDLQDILGFLDATPEERDYSVIGSFTAQNAKGNCVYCNHCQPCPMGIDVGMINKYYDLALAGDEMAKGHYHKLNIQADACISCGHCESHCPFHVKQISIMHEINQYFLKQE